MERASFPGTTVTGTRKTSFDLGKEASRFLIFLFLDTKLSRGLQVPLAAWNFNCQIKGFLALSLDSVLQTILTLPTSPTHFYIREREYIHI